MPAALNSQKLVLTDRQASDLENTLQLMDEQHYVGRVWAREAELWQPEPEQQAEISQRLGWLTIPEQCLQQVDRLCSFADQVRQADFQHITLLGMGGSSLTAWTLEHVFGVADDYPSFSVLDSTIPEDVIAATKGVDPARTLFVVVSKSGTTTEALCFFEYFYEQVKAVNGSGAGENFVVITDPGTPLAETGRQRSLRAVYENWPDLGGRYSGLSYFGMLPAALMGLPLQAILADADAMAEACQSSSSNPAARLGAVLACCQAAGRDKVTFLISPALESFGDWAEQLLAESTGKQGTGLIPVVGEPAGPVAAYGDDRLFVHLHLTDDKRLTGFASALAAAGHPLVDIEVAGVNSLGQEMFRWEFATAVAGALMSINPFDQPNVQESKDKTREMLAQYSRQGSLPQSAPDLVDGELSIYGAPRAGCSREALAALFAQVKPGDYIALMAYLPHSLHTNDKLAQMRLEIRDALKAATTIGYGPRLLHSTGQLHKGGPNSGVFLQFTATDETTLPIPGQDYDFATLKNAQAWGDFAVLQQRHRRILRIDLGQDIDRGLSKVAQLVEDALRSTSIDANDSLNPAS